MPECSIYVSLSIYLFTWKFMYELRSDSEETRNL